MDVVPYTEAFKSQMVKRLLGPRAISANALSREVGVSQAQLSRWLASARTFAPMTSADEPKKSPVVAGPKKWTAAEKLRVVIAAQGVEGSALGELLRREGLHEEQLVAWREAAAGALEESAEAASSWPRTAGERRRMGAMNKRIKALEKELRRKEKALAETAALLVLKKKMEAFWEAEGDGTDDESEK